MSPRPFTTLAITWALLAAALAPLWSAPAGPRSPAPGARAGASTGAACCGDVACCERGGACGTSACATNSALAPGLHGSEVPAVAPAGAPVPPDGPRLVSGCGGAPPAVLAGAFDPMVRDDDAAWTVARAAERAAPCADPALRSVPRDPLEPPPRA